SAWAAESCPLRAAACASAWCCDRCAITDDRWARTSCWWSDASSAGSTGGGAVGVIGTVVVAGGDSSVGASIVLETVDVIAVPEPDRPDNATGAAKAGDNEVDVVVVSARAPTGARTS